jgi:spermidine synthase
VGFLAQLVQIVLLRELLTFMAGLELVIGIALGAWMAFAAAGALGGGRLLRRADPCTALSAVVFIAGAAAPLSILLLRSSPSFLGLASGQEAPLGATALLMVLALALPATAVGAAFPLAARLLQRSGTGGAGRAYLFEAAGGAAGGVLFTFVLVHFLSPFHVLALGACGAAAMAAAANPVRGRRLLAGATAAAFAALFMLSGVIDHWSEEARWENFNPSYTLCETKDSRFGPLAVVRYRDQHSFFASGHLVFSLPDLAASSLLVHTVAVQHSAPRRVLLLGGGAAGTAREILRHPVERLDVVELDGVLLDMALTYLPPQERSLLLSDRVRLHRGDGRLFVKHATPGSWELILVHHPDPATASLNRYYTLEFFTEVRRALSKGGVCAFPLSSAPNYLSREFLARNSTIYHTFAAVFPHVRVVPGDPAIFVGSDQEGDLSLDAAVLRRRFLSRRIGPLPHEDALWFTPDHYFLFLKEDDVREVNRFLRHWPCLAQNETRPLPDFFGDAPPAPMPWAAPAPQAPRVLNTDTRPGASLANLLLWNRKMGHGSFSAILASLASAGPWPLALLPFLLLIPIAGLRAVGSADTAQRFSIAVAVGAVGLAELVFELAVLTSFQNYYGYVYREMGLLFAAFMGGIAVGTLLSQRFLADRPRPRIVAGVLAACLVCALVLPSGLALIGGLPLPGLVFFLFALITVVIGMPVGLLFPLAARAYHPTAQRSASPLYACDLAGGIVGAVLTATFLIPALGLGPTLRVCTAAVLLAAMAVFAVGWIPGKGKG